MAVLALTCLLFFTFHYGKGFNLEPKLSIIKSGPSGSYFGFSVAEHIIVHEPNRNTSVLLVGAPKATNPTLSVTDSGALFSCRLNRPECEMMTNAPFDFDAQKGEVLKDQWLGVTVRSQGVGEDKIVLVCAHRYMEDEDPLGKCFTLTQDLDYDGEMNPCSGLPVGQDFKEYGFCQAGVSGFISEDNGLVIGAPGVFDWTGVIHQKNVTTVLGVDKAWYLSPSIEGEGIQKPPVEKYAYLGYSVTAGFFDQTGLSYVSGAPRGNDTGQIVFFRKVTAGGFEGQKYLKYLTTQVIAGEQYFSSFGYDLLAVDLNNDGFDDLVVGAPFYHDENIGGAIYIYLGGKMINVYTDVKRITSRPLDKKQCAALKCHLGRFGFSLSKMGDVNMDGYQDFAVGAPYEGMGAVYIYHGSADGVVEPYAQRIYATDVDNGFSSFGYSVSGGLDMDNNGIPDLLVGGYEVEKIALILSRPIIRLYTNITLDVDIIDMDSEPRCDYVNGTKRHCVVLKVCSRYTAKPKDRSSVRPVVDVTMAIEPQRNELLKRGEFENPTGSDDVYTITKSVRLQPLSNGWTNCAITEKIFLKDSFQDKLNAINFEITYKLKEKPFTTVLPGIVPDIDNYPILEWDGGKDAGVIKAATKIEFVKECGPDKICTTDLYLNAFIQDMPYEDGVAVVSMGSTDDLLVKVEIENRREPAYETTFYLFLPEGFSYRGYEKIVANSLVQCSPMKSNKSVVICREIGNPLPMDANENFIVKLDTHKVNSTKTYTLNALVNTTSKEQDPGNNERLINVRVVVKADISVEGTSEPDQVRYSGEIIGQSAIHREDEIGPAVNHTFTVYNSGPGNIEKSTLYIMWPYEVENKRDHGKHLLYLMQPPQELKGPITCIVDYRIYNPLNMTAALPKQPTSKYNVIDSDNVTDPDIVSAREKRATKRDLFSSDRSANVVTLGCKEKTAKCHMIKCEIGNLPALETAKVVIRSRLWQSTFVEDYRKVDQVKVRSYAQVIIDESLGVEQSTTENDDISATTVAYPDIQIVEPPGIPWWVYLIAVLGGILLLVVIVLLLWKLGFFKRRKPEEMSLAMHKVQVEKGKGGKDDTVTYS